MDIVNDATRSSSSSENKQTIFNDGKESSSPLHLSLVTTDIKSLWAPDETVPGH